MHEDDKKTGRNYYVGARVSLATKKWLETYAKKMHMTVSGVIARLIEMLKALNGGDK